MSSDVSLGSLQQVISISRHPSQNCHVIPPWIAPKHSAPSWHAPHGSDIRPECPNVTPLAALQLAKTIAAISPEPADIPNIANAQRKKTRLQLLMRNKQLRHGSFHGPPAKRRIESLCCLGSGLELRDSQQHLKQSCHKRAVPNQPTFCIQSLASGVAPQKPYPSPMISSCVHRHTWYPYLIFVNKIITNIIQPSTSASIIWTSDTTAFRHGAVVSIEAILDEGIRLCSL